MPFDHPGNITRRWFVLAGASLPLLSACSSRPLASKDASPRRKTEPLSLIESIERDTSGRIGVAAINLTTGSTLLHRENERFAMCSTFKWLLGAVVLKKVEQGTERLNRAITWAADDLVFYSPVTKPLVEKSSAGIATLSIGELCAATLRTSDNTAANLLLDTMDGPAGMTQAVRAFGDRVTRLDRYEPELNENAPNDPRDTSTPLAMMNLMQKVLFGDGLTRASQDVLKDWMIANVTGNTRLRAGLPKGWTVGDRTGTSEKNANNNLAFATPPVNETPANGPLLIVSFTNAPNPTTAAANEVHARIARVVSSSLIQGPLAFRQK